MTTREQIAADWATRGFSCELWTDSPSQCWEDFTHATDELVLVLAGEMEFEIEGQVHHPEPGSELLIPAGAVHSARNKGRTTARWLYGYRSKPDSLSPMVIPALSSVRFDAVDRLKLPEGVVHHGVG